MTFQKYELTPEKWAELKPTIQQTTDGESVFINCAVVELGHLCTQTNAEGECIQTNPLFAVDILWNDIEPEAFKPYAVFPPPSGVHTFAGCEDLYLKNYCDKFPDSPYCIITTN